MAAARMKSHCRTWRASVSLSATPLWPTSIPWSSPWAFRAGTTRAATISMACSSGTASGGVICRVMVRRRSRCRIWVMPVVRSSSASEDTSTTRPPGTAM